MAKTDPHDPGVEIARGRAEEAGDIAGSPIKVGKGEVRFGTASWTDPTMTVPGVFYPKGISSAVERLRVYSQFPVVEVDATYYSEMADVAARRADARAQHAKALRETESDETFEGRQRFFEIATTLARERRLSRLAYLAEKPR